MTDDNSKPVDMDDLDAFEDEFFERETKEEEHVEDTEEKVPENEDDPLAAEDDTDAPAQAEDEDEDEEEAEEPEPKPKPKSKAQQRIEKLLERERLANERAAALEVRLSALEASKQNEVKQEEQPALRDQLPPGAPNPDAKNADGTPVYTLGEFDPKFIHDLTRFTFAMEMKAKQEQDQQEAQSRQIAEQQRVIQENWQTRLSEFEKDVPEVREDISDLVGTFQSIDPGYGEYLASVIMANDSGPQIMHYLSQNIGEAQKIVASGPAAATLAIGRLEARLAPVTETKEEKRNSKRVSDAPPPPAARARGSGSRFVVSPDTDDLDAFEREYFKKK